MKLFGPRCGFCAADKEPYQRGGLYVIFLILACFAGIGLAIALA